MTGGSILNHPFIWVWIDQYYKQLPWYKKILARLPFERFKITEAEIRAWLCRDK